MIESSGCEISSKRVSSKSGEATEDVGIFPESQPMSGDGKALRYKCGKSYESSRESEW